MLPEDLGLQVFLYLPNDGGDLIDLTGDDPGPGFGDPRNKYAWSLTLFDKDGDGPAPLELYVGTQNVQLDLLAGLAWSVTVGAITDAGVDLTDVPSLDSTDTFLGGLGGLTTDNEFLRELLIRDLPNTLESDGGSIWRYNFATETWAEVFGVDSPGGIIDDEDQGFRDAVPFGDKVYFSSSTNLIFTLLAAGDNPAKIVFSEDGENWQELTGGPLEPAEANRSIRAVSEVEVGEDGEKVLLVGTENIEVGGQIWAFREDGSWTKVLELDGSSSDRPFALTVSEFVQLDIDGELKTFAGTWFDYGFYELDLTNIFSADYDPATASVINRTPSSPVFLDTDGDIVFGPDGQPLVDTVDDNGVMQQIEFDGFIYLTSVNYTGLTSVYRAEIDEDIGDWETITTSGFLETLGDYYGTGEGQVQPPLYIWQTAVVADPERPEGALYLGDLNGERATLLKLTHDDDDNPTVIVVDEPTPEAALAFGSGAFGLRKLQAVEVDPATGELSPDQASPNALIIGTADDFSQRVPESFLDVLFPSEANVVSGSVSAASLIEGTGDEDVLLGGVRGDTIYGRFEDDIAFGDGLGLGVGRGDEIWGGVGEDIIFGMLGKDSLYGGDDEDILIGGLGNDRMRGGAGVDFMVGDVINDGPLGDTLEPLVAEALGELGGDEGFDPELAGAMRQVLTRVADSVLTAAALAGRLNDNIMGDSGNDIIIAGRGNDVAYGNADEDIIYGLQGSDQLWGGHGDDLLDGGAGRNRIYGGTGDDVIVTGRGRDHLEGNAGADRFLVLGALGEDKAETIATGFDVIRDFKQGEDTLDFSALFDVDFDPNDPSLLEQQIAAAYDSMQASFEESVDGWLRIRLSDIESDVEGSGVLVVRGLEFGDQTSDDFTFSNTFELDADIVGGLLL